MLGVNINWEETVITELTKNYDLISFDCGDTDLNEFLKEDAQKYKNQLIAKTYLVIYNTQVIAFFSIMNDSIKLDPLETENTKKLQRLHEYPALKIRRLAVDKRFKKKGIGTFIFKYRGVCKKQFVTLVCTDRCKNKLKIAPLQILLENFA